MFIFVLILTIMVAVIYCSYMGVLIGVLVEDKANERNEDKLSEAYAYEGWLGSLGLLETRMIMVHNRPEDRHFFNDLFDNLDGIFFGWVG